MSNTITLSSLGLNYGDLNLDNSFEDFESDNKPVSTNLRISTMTAVCNISTILNLI